MHIKPSLIHCHCEPVGKLAWQSLFCVLYHSQPPIATKGSPKGPLVRGAQSVKKLPEEGESLSAETAPTKLEFISLYVALHMLLGAPPSAL